MTFHGLWGFAAALKLRVLRWGDHPALAGWTQCYHKGPPKRKTGVVGEGDVMAEAEIEVMCLEGRH